MSGCPTFFRPRKKPGRPFAKRYQGRPGHVLYLSVRALYGCTAQEPACSLP